MAVAGSSDGARAASFGPFRLAAEERLLTKDGEPVKLGARALDILIVLVERPGEVVSHAELMKRVWPDVTVEESNLRVHVTSLRKALGDGRGGARYIANVPGRGYCFIAPVQRGEPPGRAPAPSAEPAAKMQMLPPRLQRMVGRDATVEDLSAQLLGKRFVSIVGPGGMGKTTVAIAVAHALARDIGGAVCFIDLGAVNDPAFVVSTVAAAVGCQVRSQDPLPHLVTFLAQTRMLLILDSCEHVISTVALLAEQLFREAPQVHLLTTTRESLRVEGENVHLLLPLDVPGEETSLTGAEAIRASAVRLFVERAAANGHRSELSEDELRVVAGICRRLDGIALAIELAASQVSAYGLQGIANLLDHRFRLLWQGRRFALPRHQTLQATLDWSFNLLSDHEQRVLCRLSLFAGSFPLEAAQEVAADDGEDRASVVEVIGNLVAKSLVQTADLGGSVFYRLLDTTRTYAAAKLADRGDRDDVARRHATYFLNLVGVGAPNAHFHFGNLARYARELDNVRAALDWAFSTSGDAEMGAALTAAYAPVWTYLGLLVEETERLERALARLGPGANSAPSLRLRLLLALGATLFFTVGPTERTRNVLADGLELAERADDLAGQLQTLWVLWGLHLNAGECRSALATAEKFASVARRTGDPNDGLLAQRLIGNAMTFRGNLSDARSRFEGVLERYVAAPSERLRFLPLAQDLRLGVRLFIARVSWLQGFADQAMRQAQACLAEAEAAGNRFSICEVLRLALAPVAIMTGDLAAADRAVTMLIDVATTHNVTFWRLVGHCLQGKLLIARGELETGVARLRLALDESDRTGWAICVPEYLGAMAEGLAGLGRPSEAIESIEAALLHANAGGEEWYNAELLRIKGELLRKAQKPSGGAEDCFHRALEVARAQGAMFFELRGAMSLSRLKAEEGRAAEAYRVLAPVYGRFTEGYETADLRAARGLLEALAPPGASRS